MSLIMYLCLCSTTLLVFVVIELGSDIEACATCPVYPQCFRLVVCDNGCDCTPERRKERIYDTVQAMKDEYKNYLNKNAHDTEL